MDKFTQRDTDGSVNIAASANAYAKALTEWVAKNEIPAEEIESAVNAVLDLHTGKNIPTPALLSAVAQELGADMDNFTVLTDRVRAYLKRQTEAGHLFVIKGKGGGVSRTAPAKKSA